MNQPAGSGAPTVGVVVPTHDRPQLLRETLAAVLGQELDPAEAAGLDVVVVYDRAAPDRSLEAMSRPGRRVRVLVNERSPGLAGARNTGILALDTDWVAFCDDDDTWLPGKLRAQLARARQHPGAPLVTTAVCVRFEDQEVPRLAGVDEVTSEQLTRSRMSMLHSSTLLLRRSALLGPLGLVDEGIPGSQNEDWDMLLRAAALAPIPHVDEPLVRVLWGRSSHFARQWRTRVESLTWMLQRHPAIAADRVGAARVYGQLAFGHAALGQRRDAARWAARALRRRVAEPRAFLALTVATRLVPADTVMAVLHRRGRGV
ncbi:glycosyltransferase family 2 protein [Blastococcus sp. KM273128]|uniref:glycosyltransferase family 2 protein n=1 Tax=Blastococcus sp. KM273128 TaxID=2570314 RepID=UPI001F4800C6|nr:glycosyltransferase family 2 protein [Blastococcus sp. KM273128]MCF6744349.1 glycosyltransferase family 2 protein [Blastococcus sp. KM273128]